MRGIAAERLGHRPAGVERHDDIVVALGAIFLGDQRAVAGRLLPVDRAAVHALAIVGERLELGALADLELRLGAVQRVAGLQLDALVAHRADVGRDQHVRGRAPSRRCFQTRPSGPGQRSQSALEPRRAAPLGAQREGGARRRLPALGAQAGGRGERAVDAERELEPARARGAGSAR